MLAIVIPYYKITFFEETLASIANQSNKNFKVYIGNDASPDDPAELIDKYSSKINLKYQIYKENLGKSSLTSHWKRCVEMTGSEEWIMILGDDDVLGKTVVETWYENLNKFCRKASVIRFATQMIDDKSNKISKLYNHPVWEIPEYSFYRKFNRITRSSLSEYVFLKSSYRKYGFFPYPLAWHSDDRAWLEFSESNKIFSINNSKVFIRISPLTISGSRKNLTKKRIARNQFFKYLVNSRLSKLNNTEKKEIVRSYHLSITAIKPIELSEFLFLTYLHIKYFDLIFFKKFLKELISPGSSK